VSGVVHRRISISDLYFAAATADATCLSHSLHTVFTMLFHFPYVVTALACAQGVLSIANDFSLYAYGEGLPTGMKLFHADGKPYVHR
jgi:hypothetical protein